MNKPKWALSKAAGAAGVAIALLILAGCGNSSDGASSPNKSEIDTSIASLKYDGPESKLAMAYPEFKTNGQKVKIGFACPACQIPGELEQANKMKAEVEKLGGTFVLADSGGDPQKQLNQFKQMIVQGVQAIILQPLVESAMAPAFEEAAKKGVAVITIVTPGDVTQPLQPGVVSNVTLGFDQAAFNKAQYFASILPKGSEVGLIGFGVPSAGIKYLTDRTKYWVEKFGLKVADQVNITDLTVQAGQTAGTSILQRHPNVKAVISFNDESANGVLNAARLLGKKDVMVCGQDFAKIGYTSVSTENGSCDVRWDNAGIGKLTADAAYMAVTKQNLPLPKSVTTGGGTLVTPKNYKSVDVVD